MHKKEKQTLRRTQHVLVILLPMLILILASLLTANTLVSRRQTEPQKDSTADTDISAGPALSATGDEEADITEEGGGGGSRTG